MTGIPRVSTSIKPVNVGGGWNLYINAASPKQDAAWKLVQFLSSPQVGVLLCNIGLPPVRSALYNDPALIKTQGFVSQAKSEIAQTITPPKSAFYADMSHLLATQFNANLRLATTPQAAADAIQTGLEQIVKRQGA